MSAPWLHVDRRSMRVYVNGKVLHTSRLEYRLLAYMAVDPVRVFTKEQVGRDLWGFTAGVSTRTIDSHACRLRRKLTEAGAPPPVFINVWGVGYRLVDPPVPSMEWPDAMTPEGVLLG